MSQEVNGHLGLTGGGVATKRAREDGDVEMAEDPVSTSAKTARSAENQAPQAPIAVPGSDLLAPQKGDCMVYVSIILLI